MKMKFKTMSQALALACVMTAVGINLAQGTDWFKDGEKFLLDKNIPKAIECFKQAGVEGNPKAFLKLCEVYPAKASPYINLVCKLSWLNTLSQNDVDGCKNALETEGSEIMQFMIGKVDTGALKKRIDKECFQSINKQKKVDVISILQKIVDELKEKGSGGGVAGGNKLLEDGSFAFFNGICMQMLQLGKDFYAKGFLMRFTKAEKIEFAITKKLGEQKKKELGEKPLGEKPLGEKREKESFDSCQGTQSNTQSTSQTVWIENKLDEITKQLNKVLLQQSVFGEEVKKKFEVFENRMNGFDNDFKELEENFECLKVRKYQAPKTISDQELISYVKNHPKLNVLSVGFCDKVTDVGMQAVGKYCKRLTQLDVSYCNKVKGAWMQAVGESFKGVTRLDLGGCDQLTDVSLQALGENFKGLTEVILHGCKQITGEGKKKLREKIWGLKIY